MSKETDRTEALRAALVRAVVDGTGLSERLAMPYANSVLAYLQREFPGERVYIPAPQRQHDLMQIAAALERGESIARVCKAHALSRTTLYTLFPGGLPRPQDEVA